jgi:hypothetical protein
MVANRVIKLITLFCLLDTKLERGGNLKTLGGLDGDRMDMVGSRMEILAKYVRMECTRFLQGNLDLQSLNLIIC